MAEPNPAFKRSKVPAGVVSAPGRKAPRLDSAAFNAVVPAAFKLLPNPAPP